MSVTLEVAKPPKQGEILNDWTVLEKYNEGIRQSESNVVVE